MGCRVKANPLLSMKTIFRRRKRLVLGEDVGEWDAGVGHGSLGMQMFQAFGLLLPRSNVPTFNYQPRRIHALRLQINRLAGNILVVLA